jgi:hypothetical protein
MSGVSPRVIYLSWMTLRVMTLEIVRFGGHGKMDLAMRAHDDEPAYPGNGSGSAVGDEGTSSFTEEVIVHGGIGKESE